MRTKFIRSLLALCISTCVIHPSQAQTSARLDAPSSWSLGMNVGMSDLWGDVGTESVIDHYNNKNYTSSMHAMGGIFVRFTPHPAFAMRLGVNYGTLYATDKWNYDKAKKSTDANSDFTQRYNRNQDIKDNIWEGSLLLEFMPLRMNPDSKSARRSGQPVILAGIGYYHFQPFSTLNGSYQKIYNLHLEGDGFNFANAPKKYDLAQLCIPVGIGYRFDIGKQLNLGVEYLYRICFTDYLDGVSGSYIDPAYYDKNLTPNEAALARKLADKSLNNSGVPGYLRGNPSNKDSYSTISLTFYYKVKSHRIPWWE